MARAAAAAGPARVTVTGSSRPGRRCGRPPGGPAAWATSGGEARPAVPDGAFDAVVTCLVLEHTDDLDAIVAEVARVLEPGGRFVLFTNHPLFQTPGSGWIDDQVLDPPEQYWRVGEYLTEVVTLEQVDAGVVLPFAHRTLSTYVNALARAGLLLDHMDEPAPPAGFLAQDVRYAAAATIRGSGVEVGEGRRGGRSGVMSEFVVITGLSSAGRSLAADDLEDLGWFVIDSLPPGLVPKVVELAQTPGSSIERVALVVGTTTYQDDVVPMLSWLRSAAAGAGAVPRGVDRRAGPPLRQHPPAAPALGRG